MISPIAAIVVTIRPPPPRPWSARNAINAPIERLRPHSTDPMRNRAIAPRSEEHTSELQSLMRTSYAVFCLKKKTDDTNNSDNRSPHVQLYTTTYSKTKLNTNNLKCTYTL